MLIHKILGLPENENVCFVEESFASLKNNTLTLAYLENIRKDPDALVSGIKDENDNIIGLVLINPESEESESFHAIFTNIISSGPIPNNSSRIFSGIVNDMKLENSYNTTYRKFNEAVIEYFSIELVNRHLCENCHVTKEPFNMTFIESRNARLNGILEKNKLKGEILEICCGNGMSTLPLIRNGI